MTLLSQDIEEEENSEVLLAEIINLWITIRGFSLSASWMEEYKKQSKSQLVYINQLAEYYCICMETFMCIAAGYS